MSTAIRNLWRAAYAATAKLLPQSCYCKPAMRVRGFFARRICESADKEINIERGAMFATSVTIGDDSGIGKDGEVHIGDHVMMAADCVLYTRKHESSRADVLMNQQSGTELKLISIGDDVWLERRMIVMPGACISEHSIGAAGAVVTKDVQSFSIVGGTGQGHRIAA